MAPEDGGTAPRHEVVTTRWGALAVRDREAGEIMHPGKGPREEAAELYVAQSGLAARLADRASAAPLVLFDLGLGAASNALAARQVAEEAAPGAGWRRLQIWSFERDLGALRCALDPAHAAAFGLAGEPGAAARALLDQRHHAGAKTDWRLLEGDALAALEGSGLPPCDLIYWDPFSPRTNGPLWSVRAFAAARRWCAPGALLITYSAATSVRSALLLAGFAVGVGGPSGTQRESTIAAVDVEQLAAPLGPRFLSRLARSSAPFPEDAPADALERLARLPQLVALRPGSR